MKKNLFKIIAFVFFTAIIALSLSACEKAPTVFNITYELDGGTLPSDAPTSYEEGSEPNFDKIIPEKEYYEFEGWYTDSDFKTEFDPKTNTATELTLYAKYEPEEFLINYNLDGGYCDELPDWHVFGEETSLAAHVPTKDGCIFDGWYFDKQFTEKADAIAEDTVEEVSVYAKWLLEPEKLKDITNIKKGFFGAGASSTSLDLSKYVNANGLDVVYSAVSSDSEFASVTVTNGTLTIDVKSSSGSADISLSVSFRETEYLKFNFTVTPKIYTKIACIGDSLTEKSPAYPEYLNQFIGSSVIIENYGESGASLTSYVNSSYYGAYKTYAEDKYLQSLASDAELIIIMLGTNDSTKMVNGAPVNDWNIVAPAYKSDYLSLINDYRTANPDAEIVIVNTPQVLDMNVLDLSNFIINSYIHPLQIEIANEAGVKLIDLHAYLSTLSNLESLYIDGIHFNEAGAEAIARYIASMI